MVKFEERFCPKTEVTRVGAIRRVLIPGKANELEPASRDEELRKQEGIAGAATLNEPREKAIVTEMDPVEQVPRAKLSADECLTYSKIRWQVADHVKLQTGNVRKILTTSVGRRKAQRNRRDQEGASFHRKGKGWKGEATKSVLWKVPLAQRSGSPEWVNVT